MSSWWIERQEGTLVALFFATLSEVVPGSFLWVILWRAHPSSTVCVVNSVTLYARTRVVVSCWWEFPKHRCNDLWNCVLWAKISRRSWGFGRDYEPVPVIGLHFYAIATSPKQERGWIKRFLLHTSYPGTPSINNTIYHLHVKVAFHFEAKTKCGWFLKKCLVIFFEAKSCSGNIATTKLKMS